MCRWLAYTGSPIPLEEVLFKPKHSLIDQSMSSRSAETPTNADGFGIGWYGSRPTPGLFRSIRPAWNDFNLRDLAGQIESRLFIAHVRATSLATVQETNCHPFRYGRWLFAHNGEVHGIELMRKRLIAAIDDDLFPYILGTTDSEVMFYLALSFGLESDPLGALARMAGFIEGVGSEKGIHESLWMTLAVSDGERLFAIRYASDGEAPTLYYTRDTDEVFRLVPELQGRLSADARLIASEPTGRVKALWIEAPQASSLVVEGGAIRVEPFLPVAPGPGPHRAGVAPVAQPTKGNT